MKAIDVRRVVAAQEALDLVPAKTARRLGLLPLAVDGDTLYAAASGTVKFSTKHRKRFDGSRRITTYVNVISS